MEQGIQKEYEMIGKYGCYLICLYKATDKEFTIDEYRTLLKRGYIDEECTVLQPTLILKKLTGKKYRVIKSNKADKDADIQIERWYNEKYQHFVLRTKGEGGKNDGLVWDSLGRFHLKQRGYTDVESFRLFYEVKE